MTNKNKSSNLITGKDLLYKYLDYNYLWSDSTRIKSKPSLFRKSQLKALLTAFELTKRNVNPLLQIKYYTFGQKEELTRAQHLKKLTDIAYFENGEFLHDREDEQNAELAEIVQKKIDQLFPNLSAEWKERRLSIEWMFNYLMRYRRKLFEITQPASGFDEGFSSGLAYAHYLQDKLSTVIVDNLEDIDNTLSLIIDPTKRVIDFEVIKKQFDYPDVNLEDIDHEWYVSNY